jgi:hypothetical protein
MEDNYWRESGRTVKFFFVDGRAMFFLLIMLYHFSLFTFGLGILSLVFLAILENYGYNIPNGLRKLRIIIFGKSRPAVIGRRRGRSDR